MWNPVLIASSLALAAGLLPGLVLAEPQSGPPVLAQSETGQQLIAEAEENQPPPGQLAAKKDPVAAKPPPPPPPLYRNCYEQVGGDICSSTCMDFTIEADDTMSAGECAPRSYCVSHVKPCS